MGPGEPELPVTSGPVAGRSACTSGGIAYLVEAAQRSTRLPSGHPEAFLEAFANIYVNVAHTIEAKRTGAEIDEISMDFPTVQDGAVGVHFIHTAIESGTKRAWVDASYEAP